MRGYYFKGIVMIAKEGFPFILGAVIAVLVLAVIPQFILVALAVLVLLLFVWFFRDPERQVPSEDNIAVSSADGKVVEVSEVEFNGVKCKKVGVFMNVFSVHVNRVPVTGKVIAVEAIAGQFVNAARKDASIVNERNVISFETAAGVVTCVQVAGLVARRCVCNAEVGDVLATGDRYGMIKFSSRVDHYFPMNFTVEVEEDDQVKAGESILARY